MKISPFNQNHSCPTGTVGFTLAEMLIAMGIFTMAIGAMVATQIFGMRIYTLAATKLSATADCRKALNSVRDQVRQAKLIDIGMCGVTGPVSFTNLGLAALQVGNAIRFTTNNSYTNGWTLIYQDANLPTTNYLKQCTVNVSGGVTSYLTANILATYITNLDIFTAQNYQGQTLTNEDQEDNTLQAIPNRLVIYVKLQFYQWEYPIAVVGPSNACNMYDYYQLRTKITRRAWN
jgi:type II secretory pathway pseudopilin PulG